MSGQPNRLALKTLGYNLIIKIGWGLISGLYVVAHLFSSPTNLINYTRPSFCSSASKDRLYIGGKPQERDGVENRVPVQQLHQSYVSVLLKFYRGISTILRSWSHQAGLHVYVLYPPPNIVLGLLKWVPGLVVNYLSRSLSHFVIHLSNTDLFIKAGAIK